MTLDELIAELQDDENVFIKREQGRIVMFARHGERFSKRVHIDLDDIEQSAVDLIEMSLERILSEARQ